MKPNGFSLSSDASPAAGVSDGFAVDLLKRPCVSHQTLCLVLTAMLPPAYLLGGIPFGVIVGRMRGVDVRSVGSGNIGATNVGRVLGKRYFYLVLLLDALKGGLPTAAASILVHANTDAGQRTPLLYGLWLGTGIAAMLGHIFSPFLGFKGGKGVATGLGLTLGVFPYMTFPALAGLLAFITAFKMTRYVSAGSLAGAAVFPVAYLAIALARGWEPFARQWPMLAISVVVAGLIILRHRENIVRLCKGTEIPNA